VVSGWPSRRRRVIVYHVGRALLGYEVSGSVLLNATIAPTPADIKDDSFLPTLAISGDNQYIMFFVGECAA
jgi:hypothetical protein